eukprot:m.669336 g.669336  ORF g.669336 m.669336 type:complete len:326 (-) comp22762_c1_seq4:490-1467(-)
MITVAAIANPAGDVMKVLPTIDGVEYIVGTTTEELAKSGKLDQVTVVCFVAQDASVSVISDLWSRVPNCKWVHSFTAGIDALGPFINEHLLNSPVPLTNGKGAFSDSLAEWVMTSVLHFNKQIPRLLHNRAAKIWDKFVMNTIAGKTLGVVGYGDIGQAAAKCAKFGFGMKVLALRNDPLKESAHADEVLGPERKEELFARSDFVLCALPGTTETHNYCSTAEFEAMKKTAVFISIGRGVCVDEDALAAALRSGQILGAAVDVFKTEPLPESNPLWDCENILLSCHNADMTADYLELGWGVFKANMECFLADRPFVNTVDKTRGY